MALLERVSNAALGFSLDWSLDKSDDSVSFTKNWDKRARQPSSRWKEASLVYFTCR
jgi:hypothetical protein